MEYQQAHVPQGSPHHSLLAGSLQPCLLSFYGHSVPVALRAAGIFAAAALALLPSRAHGLTTLDRILAHLSSHVLVNVGSIMLNLAENGPGQAGMMPRGLQPGDSVILGYTPSGVAVRETAGNLGLTVTDLQASLLGAGVPPGFYPVGSSLFQLPPGVQYSLFQDDVAGARLAEARELVSARIDGSVVNRIGRMIPSDLSELAAVALSEDALISLGDIASTALGAVNAGEIVTRVRVAYDIGATNSEIEIALAGIERGVNASLEVAQTAATNATQFAQWQIGGTADTAVLIANVASNQMAVNGMVLNVIEQQSVRINLMVTTVLGAVNGGSIDGRD